MQMGPSAQHSPDTIIGGTAWTHGRIVAGGGDPGLGVAGVVAFDGFIEATFTLLRAEPIRSSGVV
jgi:hypothetical protein